MGRNYQKPEKRADFGNPDIDLSRLPTTYYHDKSPIGVVLQKYNWFPGKENTYHADARLPASLIGMGLSPLGQLICTVVGAAARRAGIVRRDPGGLRPAGKSFTSPSECPRS